MSPARVKWLVVQLGHCYRRTGATGTAGEQPFATAVGHACVAAIDGIGGWRVRLVLADDHDHDQLFGDAFVAIHADGSNNPNARGASVGYRTRAGQAFGQAWKRCYAARGWTGGFRTDNYTPALAGYYGIREAVEAGTGAAIIVEAGFMTNPGDRTLMTGGGGPERVAAAIADALGIRAPQTGGAWVREDDSMRFVQGNAPRPWSDFVFQVTFPEEEGGPIAVREHVADPADPGYQIAMATAAGMDPRTGKPYVVDQLKLDKVPFVSDEALRVFRKASAEYVEKYRAAQMAAGR